MPEARYGEVSSELSRSKVDCGNGAPQERIVVCGHHIVCSTLRRALSSFRVTATKLNSPSPSWGFGHGKASEHMQHRVRHGVNSP